MAEIAAVTVLGIDGIKATDDGKHALLKTKIKNGEVVLAIPAALLQPLLSLICVGIEQTTKIEKRQGTATFAAHRWELGHAPDGRLAMTFRLDNGAPLSFVLGADQIPYIRQTLEVMEGKAPRDLPPNASRN